MKCLLILVLSVCAGAALAADAHDASPVPDSVQALPEAQFDSWLQGERDRIAKEKDAAQKRYHGAEFTCWKRFAVNDCLKDARRERRAGMDAARKMELAVNAAEREYRTRQRLQEIAQKQKK